MISSWRLLLPGAAALAGVSLAAAGVSAPPGSSKDVAQAPKVRARLLAERPTLVPGTTATLGVLFTIEPHWHIYTSAANDSGGPPSIEWALPTGFKPQAIQWPAAKRHALPGDLLDHVYEGEVMLLVPVAVPADAKPGSTVTLAADLTWMVCKDLCLIENQRVTLDLPVGTGDSAQIVPDPKFAQFKARLPKPVTLGPGTDGEKAGIAATWAGDELKIQVKGAKGLTFYPLAGAPVPVNLLAGGEATGETLSLRFEPGASEPAKTAPVRGVLEIRGPTASAPETGARWYQLSIPRPSGH
jgi:thiol:disulfide interchange protein DsbD